MPNGEDIAKVRQRLHRNHGRTERELRAFWTTHPTRKRTDSAVGSFAHDAFTITMLLSSTHADRYIRERMPRVVHRDSFETVVSM